MPGIIEFPKVVQDAMADYGEIFSNECQRRHFGEYLTGLMVAERKTVLGINGEFAATTDQSCLNRFLTSADWDVQVLNEQRLQKLQKDPATRYSDQGVIAIDKGRQTPTNRVITRVERPGQCDRNGWDPCWFARVHELAPGPLTCARDFPSGHLTIQRVLILCPLLLL
jgi:hypothetical protein